jgi:hypothetical protein
MMDTIFSQLFEIRCASFQSSKLLVLGSWWITASYWFLHSDGYLRVKWNRQNGIG